MATKISFILLISYAVFCFGCSNSNNALIPNNSEAIVINGRNTSDSVDISDLISNIKITLLKESADNYIGIADEVLLHGDNFVVLDKYVGKRISVFDSTGNHIAKMGGIGKGPKELLQPNDIWISSNGGIEVYDFALKKIITYDQDYNFISYKTGGGSAIFQSIMPIAGSTDYIGFASYSYQNPPFIGKHYKLAFLSADFSIEKTAFHYNKQLQGALLATPTNPFLKIKDSIRFFQNFDNFIYNISPTKEISKRYALQYHPNPLPTDFETSILKENLPLFKEQAINFTKIHNLYKGYWGFNGTWLETEKYVIFDSFDGNFKVFTSIYDKISKKIVAQGRMFTEMQRYQVILPPAFTSSYEDNRFVAVFGGYAIKGLIGKKSPFYDLVNKNLDKNFVFEFTLK